MAFPLRIDVNFVNAYHFISWRVNFFLKVSDFSWPFPTLSQRMTSLAAFHPAGQSREKKRKPFDFLDQFWKERTVKRKKKKTIVIKNKWTKIGSCWEWEQSAWRFAQAKRIEKRKSWGKGWKCQSPIIRKTHLAILSSSLALWLSKPLSLSSLFIFFFASSITVFRVVNTLTL